MAETLREKVRVTTSGPDHSSKKLASDLQLKSSQQYLDELDGLSKDPQYARETPPETRQSLQDAIAQARAAYGQKVNQNEWLEVAQTLGRAVAQFGAAQSGMKSGRDMSSLNMGPAIDYGSRSDRAFREYADAVKGAGDVADSTRQEYLDTEVTKKSRFDMAQEPLKLGLKNAQEQEADAERYKRTVEMETARSNRDAARDRERDKKDTAKSDNDQRKLELAELNKQENLAQKQLRARTQALNDTQLLDDLNTKSADKLEAGYGRLLSEADLHIQDVKAEKDGMLWGKNPDPEKTKANLKDKVTEVKNLLDGIQKRKQELIKGTSNSSPQDGKVLIEFQGKQFKVDAADVDQAVADGAKVIK